MDDQFGGRTDDDLFSDDFEPLANVTAAVPHQPAPPTELAQAVEKPETQPIAIEKAISPGPALSKAQPAVKGLAHSKYSDKPASHSPRQPHTNSPSNTNKASVSHKPTANDPNASQKTSTHATASQQAVNQPASQPTASQQSASNTATPPPSAPTGPSRGTNASRGGKKTAGAAVPGQNTALKSESRIRSGANPRTKLTEGELTERLEKMAILSAEKARKHELSEADERTHAAAYAQGMEEAKKKKAAEAERRKRGEEERRRMDAERAKNRERKLKAMENKTGGWDHGKMEEQEQEREFRGAHGGIRGARGADSLSGSRYARNDSDQATDSFSADNNYRGRGRGRGRGGPGRGRGGRGGNLSREGSGGGDTSAPTETPGKPVVNTADFPALPSADPKLSPESPTGPLNWGEEMESLDAKMAGKDK